MPPDPVSLVGARRRIAHAWRSSIRGLFDIFSMEPLRQDIENQRRAISGMTYDSQPSLVGP
jgi:hypothetical protein